MLSERDTLRRKAEADALKAWWAGPRDRPFVLPRHEEYDVCTVLFPTPASDIRFSLRYFVMAVIAKLPWSAPKVFLYRRMGVKIGPDVYIAPGVFLDAFYPWLIELEDRVFLGMGCRLFTHEITAGYFRIGRVRVGRGSVIGAGSIVRCGVTIGRGVTTGFSSVVVKDVPDGQTVGGVPARPLGPDDEDKACPS